MNPALYQLSYAAASRAENYNPKMSQNATSEEERRQEANVDLFSRALVIL